VRERRGYGGNGRARELLHRAVREAGEVLDGALERREGGTGRLVRNGHRHVRAGGERLDERPLRPCQVLEAVREYGLAVPGPEIALKSLRRGTPHAVSVPEPEPVELRPVGASETAEIAVDRSGVEQRRLQLSERSDDLVAEATRPGRRCEHLERGRGDRTANRQRALCVAGDGAPLGSARGDVLEEIVEGADTAAEERSSTAEQVSLDPLDVSPVGDDEPGIAVELDEIPLQEQRDLAGVRRTDDEREPHPPMVVPPSDAISYAEARLCAKSGKDASPSGKRLEN
jgi:hypothetical protein